jgi:hypothetical protein
MTCDASPDRFGPHWGPRHATRAPAPRACASTGTAERQLDAYVTLYGPLGRWGAVAPACVRAVDDLALWARCDGRRGP